MKRIVLSLFLVSCMGLLTTEIVSANNFTDVSINQKEIEYLTSKGIINGYPDKTYRPENPILRIQAIRMIMRDLGISHDTIPPNPNFVDIKPGDEGYIEVATAVQLGIISGKDKNRFDPYGKLTREQMAKILVNAYELGGIYPKGFTDITTRSWSYPFISSLAANNVTIGYPDGTFKPTLTINRAQFAAFMARILEPSFKPFTPHVADTFLEVVEDVHVIDAIMHPTKPVLFLIDGNDNTLVSLNYETYEVLYTELAYSGEKLAYANGKLYVTQVKHPHSLYTFDENQEGAFAVFDAETLEFRNLVHIQLDPFDIAADDQGIVYVSSGSGQWTRIESYNGGNGAILSSKSIRNQSYIEMNPKQNKIYAINTDVSPRDISTFSIVEGKLQSEVDSPYHGEYRLNENLKISPDGRYLLNGLGGIFRASAISNADMTYIGALDRPFTSIAFDLIYGELYSANGKNLIQVYDYNTFVADYQLTSYGNINYMFYNDQNNSLILLSTVKLGDSPKPFLGIEKIYFNIE